MTRVFLALLLLASSLSIAVEARASGSESLVFLPMIARDECSDLCGYCFPSDLDHVMGC